MNIRRAAVLGAGTMGSQIAAHLANVGIDVLLLDIVPKDAKGPEDRNRLAQQGLERTLKTQPPAFYDPEFARRIQIGNFEDDLHRIRDVDWVIEAIVENLEIKRSLLQRVLEFWHPGIIVTTNTSGLSIRALSDGFPEDFQRHFLGTHFFNPPRFMKLLELIPSPQTDPDLMAFMEDFATQRLGKGVVHAKDTPNFIANRLGVFGILQTIHTMIEMDLTIEEVDAITGRAMGRPRSATFRTIDLVGVDVLLHVARNVYENAPDDEMREIFKPPEFLERMVEKGLLGDKAGGGFYKKVDGQRLALDWKTLEYRERQKPRFASVDRALMEETPADRIRTLLQGSDRASEFAWKTLSSFLLYAANRIPEIADDIVQVDRAIRWGFNFRLGPFETYDVIGVQEFAERIQQEGRSIPPLVQTLLDSGFQTFYTYPPEGPQYFDISTRSYRPVEFPQGFVLLESLKAQGKEVLSNPDASLIDLGDGVALLEFHSRANVIGPGTIQMVFDALEKVRTDFIGMVIGNRGRHFSAGANLALILQAIAEEEWDELDWMVQQFQKANLALKYFEKPIVAAPFGRVLGGGVEICMHAHRVQAAAETYMGLVEVAVGLLPAGGGTKEMLLRYTQGVSGIPDVDLYPMLREALVTIGMAKVSMSAHEAKKLRYLRSEDGVTLNDDFLISHAKEVVLEMEKTGFTPPLSPQVRVLGSSGFAYLQMLIYNLKEGNQITEHDAVIATEIAKILTGGDVPTGTLLSEQDLLDLEREGFLRLCGMKKTQQRIVHMLEKGRPLRN